MLENKALEELERASAIIKERGEQYGNAQKNHAKTLLSMFPDGITLKTEDDFSRFASLNMCVAKMTRYATNFEKGGHKDSASDLVSYASMLSSRTKDD